jgi:hypothetical protein
LEKQVTLLYLWETDLEMHEVILAEELEDGLHPPDEQDLSAELDKARACVDRTTDDRVAKAECLSWQVMHVAGILVDLGLLSIVDIPKLPKIAREVLPEVTLILEHLQEAMTSDAGPWD